VKDRYLYMVILPELFGIAVSVLIILLLVLDTGWYIVLFRPSEKLKVISYSSDLGRHGTCASNQPYVTSVRREEKPICIYITPQLETNFDTKRFILDDLFKNIDYCNCRIGVSLAAFLIFLLSAFEIAWILNT